MALLNVNPTRMELLNLRRRLVVSRRGHRLLKDKQDELMRRFMELIDQIRGLREEVERSLQEAHIQFIIARAMISRAMVEEALLLPKEKPTIKMETGRIMNVVVPRIELEYTGDTQSYGYASTTGDLDLSLAKYAETLPLMVRLANIEKAMEMMADEIERTRRRVNALEYVVIPNLEETIKYIGMKLSEDERGNLVRLMKIKDIVRGERTA
ncbi:MAG: V-type ATP synthase subunit D [bacterium]